MPRKQQFNDKTQEILVLLASGLNYNEIAHACNVSRMWVYSIAKREMKRLGTNNTTELLPKFCEAKMQRAQEIRATAERLIEMAAEIEKSSRQLLSQIPSDRHDLALKNPDTLLDSRTS